MPTKREISEFYPIRKEADARKRDDSIKPVISPFDNFVSPFEKKYQRVKRRVWYGQKSGFHCQSYPIAVGAEYFPPESIHVDVIGQKIFCPYSFKFATFYIKIKSD